MINENNANVDRFRLPNPPDPSGIYTQVRFFGTNFIYVSGMGPNRPDKKYVGKLGSTYSLEDGQEAAKSAAKNLLSVLQRDLGELKKIKSIVKILCFVASEDNFYLQPQVANAASNTLIEYLGENAGRAARSAIGVNVLPENIPFEIEALIELY